MATGNHGDSYTTTTVLAPDTLDTCPRCGGSMLPEHRGERLVVSRCARGDFQRNSRVLPPGNPWKKASR